MSESNKIQQGFEPGGRRGTVEGSAAMQGLTGKQGIELVNADLSRHPKETAGWVYGFLKRSKVKTHVVANWVDWGTEDFVDTEYAFFVDLVKQDSLLQAAVLDHYVEGKRLTVFRDGSQAEFLF